MVVSKATKSSPWLSTVTEGFSSLDWSIQPNHLALSSQRSLPFQLESNSYQLFFFRWSGFRMDDELSKRKKMENHRITINCAANQISVSKDSRKILFLHYINHHNLLAYCINLVYSWKQSLRQRQTCSLWECDPREQEWEREEWRGGARRGGKENTSKTR